MLIKLHQEEEAVVTSAEVVALQVPIMVVAEMAEQIILMIIMEQVQLPQGS
jgi:hypothetical protein